MKNLQIVLNDIRDRSFITFAKFSEKITLLTSCYAHICVSEIRDDSFSENFANVINELHFVKYALSKMFFFKLHSDHVLKCSFS